MNPVSLAALIVPVSEDLPGPSDYDPGWGLFALVVFLLVAVVVLALSFRKQLRKTDAHFTGDSDSASGENDQKR